MAKEVVNCLKIFCEEVGFFLLEFGEVLFMLCGAVSLDYARSLCIG